MSRTPSTSSRSDADVDPDRSTWTDFERAAGAVLDALQPGDLVTYGEVAAEAGTPAQLVPWARCCDVLPAARLRGGG